MLLNLLQHALVLYRHGIARGIEFVLMLVWKIGKYHELFLSLLLEQLNVNWISKRDTAHELFRHPSACLCTVYQFCKIDILCIFATNLAHIHMVIYR